MPMLLRYTLGTLLLVSVCATASDQAAEARTQPAAPAAKMTAAECEVWNRERSFAHSIEQGDAVAFAEHIQAEAVFQAGTALPQRGRAAIVAAWQPMVSGAFPLRWHPGVVSIGGDPDIALSHGPAWFENTDTAAAARWRTGSFVSTWVRDTDGAWRVLFDRSAQPFRDASVEEISALLAALPENCPRG
ncbi:MAG: YybH family protein [Pseudomarimonas sp.]